MVQALQLRLRIRRVHVHEPELRELQRADAPFRVQLGNAHGVQRLQRLLLAEYGRAGVALLLRVAPVVVVTGQIQVHLTFLQLRFLQGEYIGIQCGERLLEALPQHRT